MGRGLEQSVSGPSSDVMGIPTHNNRFTPLRDNDSLNLPPIAYTRPHPARGREGLVSSITRSSRRRFNWLSRNRNPIQETERTYQAGDITIRITPPFNPNPLRERDTESEDN